MTGVSSAVASLVERLAPAETPSGLPSDLVVAPTTVEEVAEVMATASGYGLEVAIWGGGSHQGYGYRSEPDVVVLTTALDGIIDWQPEDLTLVVEAGRNIGELEAMLAERGQTALLPEEPGAGTVGGAIAAGLSGWRRLRFGPTRDRVLEATLVTGDGRGIRAGGRVVKNVTGYDIPRLAVGSLGSLGVIVSVCLKLWPRPLDSATVKVADAADALSELSRPLAALETENGAYAFLGGTSQEVGDQADGLGGEAQQGLAWPARITEPCRLTMRVPPSDTAGAVAHLRNWPQLTRLVAQHGVGIVDGGGTAFDFDWSAEARSWAESRGGALTVSAAPAEVYATFDPWGRPPASLSLQRRVKSAFDPEGISNPGRLPGRL